jgi:predicted MFS family arabinose efflux permease
MAGLINKVIKVLIVSDFFLNAGWGLLSPVFAIFILQNIASDNPAQSAKIAGFAALIYWLIKSSLQIPIGRYLDKNHGEEDDFWFMVGGMLVVGLVPFGFLAASQAWHIYLLQAVYGFGMALALPSWLAIFTRHIDKGKEAFEWGAESASLGLGAGIGGAVGGLVAAIFGFWLIFVLVGSFTIFSSLLMLVIRREISPKVEDKSSGRYSTLRLER